MKTPSCGFSSKVVALAAAFGLSLAGLHRTEAAPSPVVAEDGPTITLLSPAPHASFSGDKPVEISAFYRSSSSNGIVSLELYIDGVRAQSKTLDVPESKGIVSFLVDASLLSPGAHRVIVRATAADADVCAAKGAFAFAGGGLAPSLPTGTSEGDLAPSTDTPELRLLTPAPNSKVQGTVVIQVGATDAGGKTPYVSIFVDGEFKTLVNYRPFEYEWDTTTLSNGWHTIAITEAFDTDAQAVSHVKPVRVYVNNPGGATSIRHDLQDGVKPMPVRPAQVQPAQVQPMPVRPAPVSKVVVRKTTVLRPLARRPSGEALLASPVLAEHPRHATALQMAKADLSWDDLRLNMDQGLSDPFVPELPAPAVKAPARPAVPVSGFKPRPAAPHGSPLVASLLPYGKQSQTVSPSVQPLPRMAEAGPQPSNDLSSPFLSLPKLPALTPRRIAITTAHPAVQAHLMQLALHMPHLQIHLPQLHLLSPSTTIKPHVTQSAASLLSSIGQTQVLFNTTKLQLDRPLAAQQSVVFGPLRQIFEYGGGSLQWSARTGVVRAQTQDKDISLTIGKKQATVNAKSVAMDAAPYLSSGRTMIPLSFLPAAMDVTVQYDPITNHLRITSKN